MNWHEIEHNPIFTPLSPLNGKIPRPFVSIIFTGTNDSPQFLRRVCLMLSFLTQTIVDRNISAEIIVVDWASSPEQPSFGAQIAKKCVLFWPLRIVVVPVKLNDEIHGFFYESFPNLRDDIAKIHLFGELAKNVGARRSLGEFLVFINGDTVISPALLMRLQPNTLKKGFVYRAARWELDVGDYVDSDGLSSDVVQVFKHFESECNMAQGKAFADLNRECWEHCLPSGHCFSFDSRLGCLATDTEYIHLSPQSHYKNSCPNPIGFEDFCKNGVTPDLDDPDAIFADASGM